METDILRKPGGGALNVALENYRRNVSEAKRASILKAAREIFLTNGFSGAAVADVAREADVSTATLYKHFASKEDLFAAVVKDAYEIRGGEFESLPEDLSVEDLLVAILHRYLTAQFDQQINALPRVVIAEVPKAPDLARDLYQNLITQRYTELEDIVARLIAAGRLKKQEPRYAVRLIGGAVKDYLIWPALFDANLTLPPDTDELLHRIVRDYLTLYGTGE